MYLELIVKLKQMESIDNQFYSIDKFAKKHIKRSKWAIISDIFSKNFKTNTRAKSKINQFIKSYNYSFRPIYTLFLNHLTTNIDSDSDLLFSIAIPKTDKEGIKYLREFKNFLSKIYPYPILDIYLHNTKEIETDALFEEEKAVKSYIEYIKTNIWERLLTNAHMQFELPNNYVDRFEVKKSIERILKEFTSLYDLNEVTFEVDFYTPFIEEIPDYYIVDIIRTDTV